ncbi:MAG: hypothetical protein K9M03_00810 [Kiritimatiellales bacterium]|nr:hypothetical protein [Kiritimatiellales bacterium]
MKKQTKQSKGIQWTMEDIYNLLMYDIEPELMTDQIADLDVLYFDESEDEHKDRMARYKEAFEEFFEKFEKLMSVWKGELGALKKEMFAALQAKINKGESNDISNIEDSIQSA